MTAGKITVSEELNEVTEVLCLLWLKNFDFVTEYKAEKDIKI